MKETSSKYFIAVKENERRTQRKFSFLKDRVQIWSKSLNEQRINPLTSMDHKTTGVTVSVMSRGSKDKQRALCSESDGFSLSSLDKCSQP